MSHIPATSRLRHQQPRPLRSLSRIKSYLRLIFISGPQVLLTARISKKCALVMALMCAPSLIFCGLLTLPELIFKFPQQQAYFHFCQVLNEDPARWIVLALAGLCTLLSLAAPAAMREPRNPIRY